MAGKHARRGARAVACLVVLTGAAALLTSCSADNPATAASRRATPPVAARQRQEHGTHDFRRPVPGRMTYPLVPGAAWLVIYANGSVTVGAWDIDVGMTQSVVAVRQNLAPLISNGQPTALAGTDWRAWDSRVHAAGPGAPRH